MKQLLISYLVDMYLLLSLLICGIEGKKRYSSTLSLNSPVCYKVSFTFFFFNISLICGLAFKCHINKFYMGFIKIFWVQKASMAKLNWETLAYTMLKVPQHALVAPLAFWNILFNWTLNISFLLQAETKLISLYIQLQESKYIHTLKKNTVLCDTTQCLEYIYLGTHRWDYQSKHPYFVRSQSKC